MDLVRERDAKDTKARFGFAMVCACYVLTAILTSVPSPKSQLVTRLKPSIALAPTTEEPPLVVRELVVAKKIAAAPATWWLAHQSVARREGKWWEQHRFAQVDRMKRVRVAHLLAHRPFVKPKLFAKMILKRVKPPIVAKLVIPPEVQTKPVVSPEPAPVSLLKPVLVVAKPVAPPKPAPALVKEQKSKPAEVKPPIKIVYASLSPLKMYTAHRSVQKISYGGFADLLPVMVSRSIPPLPRDRLVEHSNDYCVGRKIAGWSGIELLPEHKELLEKSSTEHSYISEGLAGRLAAKGFTPGTSVFMRIFKDKSELEVWLKKGERYALYRSYKICRWSGSFGPKLYEGDKQSPEGFYLVNRQLFNRPSWKWKDSFSIGYPNAYDKLHGRTGSLILVHGGCTSSGCFAMTDPVIQEVHELAKLARENGQKKFSMHVFPFELTAANMKEHENSAWMPFWNNLKEGYDLFEKTGLPPRVRVCHKRYVFAPNGEKRAGAGWSGKGCYGLAARVPGWKPAARTASKAVGKRNRRRSRRSARKSRRAGVRVRCNLKRASCRRWAALRRSKAKRRHRRARAIGRKRK